MLNHLEALLSAPSVEALWALHLSRMESYGFDSALYAFIRFRNSGDFGKLEDMLILSNHSQDYIAGFIYSRRFERGPMTRWAMQHSGACLWSWIEKERFSNRLTQDEQEVVAFNLAHGIRAGVSIAFPDVAPRSSGAIGLCANDTLRQHQVDALWAEKGREIFVANSVFHMRVSAMPFATSARRLSTRQREVLEWVAAGKATAAIAVLMGVTQTTVEKHLRLAREALDVDTTAQAVLKASIQRQIFIVEDEGERRPMPIA